MISTASLVRLFAAFSVLTIASALVACSGFTEEEATARCDQERDARGEQGCFGAVEYDQCLAAYQDCGQDVEIVDGCPVQYNCPVDPDDTEETTAEE
jgi:hypothetical protein